MSSAVLEDCFTCYRRTENFLRITEKDEVSGENVEEIFAKHFWFTKDEYRNRKVCTSCWEKIDEFHKFYCQVEKTHAPETMTEVKLEPDDCHGVGAEAILGLGGDDTLHDESGKHQGGTAGDESSDDNRFPSENLPSLSNVSSSRPDVAGTVQATSKAESTQTPPPKKPEVVTGADGKTYIQIEDGYYAEVKTTITEKEPELPVVDSTARADLDKARKRLESIDAKIESQQLILERFMTLMAGFSNSAQMDLMPSHRMEATPSKEINFEEFEMMLKIDTEENLVLLDSKLLDPTFVSNFLQYFQTVYKLTGKREGIPFFKTIMRRLLVPTVLLPYSWKGNSRTSKRGESMCSNGGKNLSFRTKYPNFVKFIKRVVSAADYQYTDEDNEKAFSEYLRQKNTEVKRYANGKGMVRASCSRKRRRVTPEQQKLESEPQRVAYPSGGDVSYDDEIVWEDVDNEDIGGGGEADAFYVKVETN